MLKGTLDEVHITVLVENSVGHASRLRAAHGLALLVRVRSGDVDRTILVDAGPAPDVLLGNMDMMGIDPAVIDLIVLTHCHPDHTGGLVGVIEACGQKNIPIIAHPALFRVLLATRPALRYAGIDSSLRRRVEDLGGVFILASDPLPLMDGLGTTGEIPRVTDFEQTDMPRFTVDGGQLLADDMPDDIAVVARLSGGLVVITGCSHAGVINTIKRAQQVGDCSSVHAVAGGFHLVRAGADRIARTVDELASLDPARVITGHCTGAAAQMAFGQRLADRFSPLVTGDRFQL